jgi:hypothetical protein
MPCVSWCTTRGITKDGSVPSTHFALMLEVQFATAIVFPIVFSINSAYKRREAVLDDYAALKAHGRNIKR